MPSSRQDYSSSTVTLWGYNQIWFLVAHLNPLTHFFLSFLLLCRTQYEILLILFFRSLLQWLYQPLELKQFDFSLNVFIEFAEFKVFIITAKGFKPATSCIRDQDATTVPARHVWKTGSLNWVQFMLQWFGRFP